MTAYQGAAVSGILSGSTLAAALGIWATEAYHAGAIRALLIQNIGAPELAVSSNGMNTTITLDQIVSPLGRLSCHLAGSALLPPCIQLCPAPLRAGPRVSRLRCPGWIHCPSWLAWPFRSCHMGTQGVTPACLGPAGLQGGPAAPACVQCDRRWRHHQPGAA